MAGQYDGEIRINTAIETDGFVSGGKEVEAAARRMAKTVSGIGASAKISLQKQTDTFVKQNQAYAQQEQKVESLKEKLKKLSEMEVATEEFAEIGKQIDSDTAKLDKLLKTQEEFLATGGKKTSSAYKKRKMQIEELRNSIKYAKTEQDELLSSGKAYTASDTSAMREKFATEQQKLTQMNTALGTSYESLKAKVQSYGGESKKLAQIKNNLNKTMNKLISSAKRAGSAILGLNKQTKSTGISLGKMLATSLLFSTVFRAISLVTGGIGEGFQNLAQYSVETNASISSLISALTQLKNSFATAFAPILKVVAPLLTSFINLISKAITYVGMFIAALTGQKTFTKAVGVQENYAESLKETSDNAEKAKKSLNDYLSPLDEISRYETNQNSDLGTDASEYKAPTPNEMFETVSIENSIKGIVDKIKKLIKGQDWEGLGAYLASGINSGLQKVYNAINWNNVGPKITYFVNAFTRTFNSLVDNVDWDLLGRTIGAGINTIVNTLNLLIEGIDWINLGKSFATGVMGLVNEVNWTNLGNLLGNKFMIAWKLFYGFVTNLDYKQLGLSLANLINGAIDKIDLGMMAASLSTFVVGLLKMLSTAIQNTNWTAVGQQIANALRSIDWVGIAAGLFDVGLQLIKGLLQAFGQLPVPVQIAAAAIAGFFAAFKGYAIIKTVSGLISGAGGISEAIKLLISTLGGPWTLAIAGAIAAGVLIIANWDKIKEAAGKLKDKVSQEWDKMKESCSIIAENFKKNVSKSWEDTKTNMQKFNKWLQGVFSHDWTVEFGVIGDVINGALKTISDVWSDAKQIFNGVIKFINGTFSGNWKEAWEGIKDIFSGVFKGLGDIAKTPLNIIIGAFNGILSIVNGLISKLNSIKFKITIPEWVPVVGGKWWGFNGFNIAPVGKIPYLATGAVIPPNAPFMAMLGDQKNGTNIETPEKLLRQIIREELGNQNNAGSGNFRFTAQLNRRTIFDEIITEAKLRQMNNGRNPFELA